MEFNVSKCKVTHYGKGNICYGYSMDDQSLEVVDSEKDPGVTFTSDLKAATHCKEAYFRANRTLGLISGTIKYKNPVVLTNLVSRWSDLTWNTVPLHEVITTKTRY